MNTDRDVIKCGKCGLNQFIPVDELCRKCRESLKPSIRQQIEEKQRAALAAAEKIEARLRWARTKARQRARKKRERVKGTILGQFAALCRGGQKRAAKKLLWTQISTNSRTT